jgi:hypothetical protein
MAIKFVNDFVAQLQSGLGATDTTATLTTEMYNKLGEMASEDYFCAMLSDGSRIEYAHITGKQTAPDITLERGKEGTSALDFSPGDTLSVVNTAGMYSEFLQRSVFQVPEIQKPVNQSPADGSTGEVLSPDLVASSYYSLYGKTHQASQFQVSTVSDFASTVEDVTLGGVTTHTVDVTLDTLTTYYWRVRYQDADGTWSEWSQATSFETADVYIDTPTITSPADGATDQTLTPTISADAFSCVNGSDTHESSDWQIATDSGFTSIAWESLNDTSNLESITVPEGNLASGTEYYARVRYTGATNGDSSYSSATTFTTDEVAQPSITSPTDGATGVSLTADLVGDAFSVGSSDTHDKSDWEVATDDTLSTIAFSSYDDASNLENITMSGLDTDTLYYARTRYHGSEFGWSDWSATISFTTADIYIQAPTITNPADGATDIGETVTFTTGAFSCVNGADSHASSSWWLYDNTTDTLVWSSVGDAINLTSITLPGGNHQTSTEYRLEVVHTGSTYGDSAVSSITYTTASSFFDHGPGPGEASLTMDDTRDVGYYGVATSAEVCDGPTLASDIGLSAGTAFNDTAGWLKFYVGPNADCNKDGVAKVLFIAKETLRNNLSWDDIYLAGAVYGTGDNGTANASTGTSATQDAQVTYGGYTFKVRLLTGSATDPAAEGYGNQQCLDDAGAGSEWNDLLYRVHTDVPDCGDPTIGMPGGNETTRHGGPQDGTNWASYTNAELQVYYSDAGDGTYCWCQEQGNDTSRRVYRGYGGVAAFITLTADTTSTSFGWRPVLEMIQP